MTGHPKPSSRLLLALSACQRESFLHKVGACWETEADAHKHTHSHTITLGGFFALTLALIEIQHNPYTLRASLQPTPPSPLAHVFGFGTKAVQPRNFTSSFCSDSSSPELHCLGAHMSLYTGCTAGKDKGQELHLPHPGSDVGDDGAAEDLGEAVLASKSRPV